LIAGFTLIELLIVVAIIGILSAVGIPAYNGYITSSKEDVAVNDLRAISLMESSFFSDNNNWFVGATASTTTLINTNLFGTNTLDTNSDYDYSIVTHDSGFQAVAAPKTGTSVTRFCLTQNNELESEGQCP
jgi:prepilin-type N-terminal cleavage/methylation domain-containing protein